MFFQLTTIVPQQKERQKFYFLKKMFELYLVLRLKIASKFYLKTNCIKYVTDYVLVRKQTKTIFILFVKRKVKHNMLESNKKTSIILIFTLKIIKFRCGLFFLIIISDCTVKGYLLLILFLFRR